jgi:adenosylcobinamide-phosphate synthase
VLIEDDSLHVLLLALVVDALIGDPDWLWKRVPHPVVMFGWAIDRLDGALNNANWSDAERRVMGGIAVVVLVAGAGVVGWLIEHALRAVPLGWLLEAVVASVFIAQRSLYDHVARVRRAFASGGLDASRRRSMRPACVGPRSKPRPRTSPMVWLRLRSGLRCSVCRDW